MTAIYHEYLASRAWALKREAVRRRSGNRCERCRNAPQQAVHHLTYAHLYGEPLEDLQAICDPCHEFLSGLSDEDPLTAVSRERQSVDRHLIISIRRRTICATCLFPTNGDHYTCQVCRRQICPGCAFNVGGARRCVDHAGAA